MLTRQERQEIAERAKACKKEEELNWDQYSYVLLGVSRWRNDEALLDRIVDLCDTSNMIELPLDKDGEVIHAGDTVYVGDREFTVNGFIFNDNGVTVRVVHAKLPALNFYKSNELTHKKTVTIT